VIDPLILARSVHIAATVLASGTVCFMVPIADIPALRRQLTLMMWGALAVAIISGIGWLVLVASDILGGSIAEVCLHGGLWEVTAGTRFGMVSCARLLLALMLGLLMLAPRARWLQLTAAILLIGMLALVGHAGATPGMAGRIHLASDVVHLLAAAAWLGGLPALVLLLARAGREPGVTAIAAAATRRFSVLGIVSVAALLASGAINSWNLLAAPADLVATDYGRLVLLKIALFAAMVGIAAVNRYTFTPRLPAPSSMRALRRNSLCEIGLGLCVLLVVGVLGTLPPTAHVHISSATIPPQAAYVHIHTAAAMADVTVDPRHAGTSKITVRVMREDFTPFIAGEIRLALALPGGSGEILKTVPVLMADGTWQATMTIPTPGAWNVRVTVVPEAGAAIVLDAPIVITQCSNEC
jgi:putative copper resistance protein D